MQTNMAAWLLGLEGVALLRSGVDGHDSTSVHARLDEIRRMVERLDDSPFSVEEELVPIDCRTGYGAWAERYDSDDNPLIALEEPLVRGCIDTIPPGAALDLACGTGRHAVYLASRGHRVIGIDDSPAMLALAQRKEPAAEFQLGRLDAIPVDSGSCDLAVCALALVHQKSLASAMAELSRVVRPGGHVIVSDIHYLTQYFGGLAMIRCPDGRLGVMPTYCHFPTAYLSAAIEAGFSPIACSEPVWPTTDPGPLAREWCPEAAADAHRGIPGAVILFLRRV